MLSIMRPRFEVEKSNARRNTFGKATSSRERGESAPKKITVGRDILTVPRRKSVNHAVTAATARERTEIVSVIVSNTDLNAMTGWYNRTTVQNPDLAQKPSLR
jgi:hypothetical protein